MITKVYFHSPHNPRRNLKSLVFITNYLFLMRYHPPLLISEHRQQSFRNSIGTVSHLLRILYTKLHSIFLLAATASLVTVVFVFTRAGNVADFEVAFAAVFFDCKAGSITTCAIFNVAEETCQRVKQNTKMKLFM